jgi:hypothetical protein
MIIFGMQAAAAADQSVPFHQHQTNVDAADLNRLLRDEISASEAFGHLANIWASGIEGTTCRGVLWQIHEEHALAADAFRELIHECNQVIDDRSGSWGAWGAALRCASRHPSGLLGDDPILRCLRVAEQQMMETYIECGNSLEVPAARFVHDQLLPAQRRHIAMLRQLLGEEDGAV